MGKVRSRVRRAAAILRPRPTPKPPAPEPLPEPLPQPTPEPLPDPAPEPMPRPGPRLPSVQVPALEAVSSGLWCLLGMEPAARIDVLAPRRPNP